MKLIEYVAVAAGLLSGAAACAAQEVNVTVAAAKPGAIINKNIYGQFAEHLGTGIYGGMWVGPESKIPNIKGWRKDVVAALKALDVPVSPTSTTGAMASARATSVRSRSTPTGAASTITMPSARMRSLT